MAKSVEEIAFEIGEKIAEEQGVYLVDASFDKEKDGDYLRLYIDTAEGVGLDECEAFSNEFDSRFDENLIKSNYNLEVSSPGVDRILKKEREFRYYNGREVEVKLYSAVNGKKEFEAVLSGYEDKTVKLTVCDEEISVPLSQAVYIRLAFKF